MPLCWSPALASIKSVDIARWSLARSLCFSSLAGGRRRPRHEVIVHHGGGHTLRRGEHAPPRLVGLIPETAESRHRAGVAGGLENVGWVAVVALTDPAVHLLERLA